MTKGLPKLQFEKLIDKVTIEDILTSLRGVLVLNVLLNIYCEYLLFVFSFILAIIIRLFS